MRDASGLFDLRPGEARRTLLMAASVLTTVAAYTMVKAVRDAVFLARFSLAHMSLLMVGIALFAGGATTVVARLGGSLPRARFVAVIHGVVGVSLLVLWQALLRRVPGAAWLLYVWSSFFGLFVITQFWLLANELYDARSARRLFALLGAGAILGGIGGGELARFLAPRLGAVNLLPIVAGGFALAAALSAAAGRVGLTPHRAEPMSGARHGLAILRRHRYLRLIAGMLLLSTIATTLLDLQVKSIAQAVFGSDGDAMAAFFGRLAALLSLASLVVQLTFTARFLRRFGVAAALFLLPSAVALGAGAIALQGVFVLSALACATVAKLGDGGLRFSVDKAAMELLYLPVASEAKAAAKPVIDTAVDRLGTALSGLLWLAVTAVSATRAQTLVGAAVVTVVVALLWIVLIVKSRRAYVHAFRGALEAGFPLAPGCSELQVNPAGLTPLLLEEAETLRRAGEDQLTHCRQRIFSLLALGYAPRDVAAVRRGLGDRDPARRGQALELLANLVEPTLRGPLLDALEDRLAGPR